jgi:hypothetical protein
MYRRIFFITRATSSGARSVNAGYDGKETGLPIYFAIRTERTPERGARGTVNNNLIYISWQTTSETNTSHFELMRSENGCDFELIETFMACGISKTSCRYSTTDLVYTYCSDKLFYRLKLVFTNGKEEYTDVIALNLNKVASPSVYDLTYVNNQ